MVKLSENSHAISWLSQFHPRDQELASNILDSMSLVSRDQFAEGLQDLILEVARSSGEPVGLYVEREMKRWKGIPHRLFKESRNKRKRATGNGPKIIDPKQKYDQDVGSEGIVSQIVTEIRRKDRERFYVNPGPKQIRDKKIRAFILVTDFIGTGNRVNDYLTAAWRIASVKSWVSLNLLSFHVVAYSGTAEGMRSVRAHKSKPSVHEVLSCPTIGTVFTNREETSIKDLCIKYNPDKHPDDDALGYGGTGGLIVFAHGAPNNLPKILIKKSAKWRPLFSGRSTSNVRSIFGEQQDDHSIPIRLQKLNQDGITRSGWLSRKSNDAKSLIVLMAALKSAPRFNEILSRKTGLTIPEIKVFLGQLENWAWINENRRLTDEGYKQLKYARKFRKTTKTLPKASTHYYYPNSLRMPYDISS